jgi:hypothetical protein
MDGPYYQVSSHMNYLTLFNVNKSFTVSLLFRQKAYEKAKAMKSHIAYPEELLEETNLLSIYDGVSLNIVYSFKRPLIKVSKTNLPVALFPVGTQSRQLYGKHSQYYKVSNSVCSK